MEMNYRLMTKDECKACGLSVEPVPCALYIIGHENDTIAFVRSEAWAIEFTNLMSSRLLEVQEAIVSWPD